MRPAFVFVPALVLALGPLTACASASPLARGDGEFRLGMLRAQVDTVVARNGAAVISDGGAFLVCESDDPMVEYVQYAFYQAPHGMDILWKVTIGYRHGASTADYAAVREELRRRLGEPATDTWQAGDEAAPDDLRPATTTQRAIWADGSTAVLLGARWTTSPDPNPDRMVVSWTDRKLQRLVEVRRRKDKNTATASK
jgi:hypothetical protein